MISIALVSMLAGAGSPSSEGREAYARCLKEFKRVSLEQKMEPAAFDAAVATACRDKQLLFKTALINADVAMGMKRAASEKAIGEQIADYIAMAKEDFRAELASAPKNTP
jgi:D-alanyl-D-alanine dipeptidase